jgi:hypothetical protein
MPEQVFEMPSGAVRRGNYSNIGVAVPEQPPDGDLLMRKIESQLPVGVEEQQHPASKAE